MKNSDTVNKGKQHFIPVSLLLYSSAAASLGLFPFTSASLCSKLPQDSLLERLSSVGDGGKLPSREVLHEKDILREETLAEKVQKKTTKRKVLRSPDGVSCASWANTDSLQQWNKALNTPSLLRPRPLELSANEDLAHVLNVQPCLVTFSARLMRRLLLLQLLLLPRPREATGSPHTPLPPPHPTPHTPPSATTPPLLCLNRLNALERMFNVTFVEH